MKTYGLRLSYASIFTSSLVDMIPIQKVFDANYTIYICIFAAVAIPLSSMDLSNQVLIQLVSLIDQMVMVMLMIATVAVAWLSVKLHFDKYADPHLDVPLFRFQ